jgi:predicted small lipoprotein YifL
MKASAASRLLLCFVAAMPLALTAACGQKGGLYLPPRNGTVVTRPAGAAVTPPQSTSPQDSTTRPSTSSKQPDNKNDDNDSQNPQPPKQP